MATVTCSGRHASLVIAMAIIPRRNFTPYRQIAAVISA